MKTLVIGGNEGFWNYKEKQNSDYDINGVENWAFALQGDYIGGNAITLDLINKYDLVISNLNFDKAPYMKQAKSIVVNRNSNVKWITLIENDALVYLGALHKVKFLLDHSDLIIGINTHSMPFLKSMTTTPIELIGIPYNIDRIVKLRKPIAERNKRTMLLANPLKQTNEFQLIAKTDYPYTMLIPKYSRNLKNVIALTKKHNTLTLDKEFYLKLVEKRLSAKIENYFYTAPLAIFLKYLSSHYMALNLDERYTWSRNVLDCAALGVPVVSTANTEHTAQLFPELMVANCFALDHASELTHRLYNDPEFYAKQANPDLSYFEQYNYTQIKERLLNSLGNTNG